MPATQSPSLSRADIERLVRNVLSRQLGGSTSAPAPAGPPNPLVVNISARHCHLTEELVEFVLGMGRTLRRVKFLYKDGF
ncbi:MAG: hypothetical protein ACF8TS_13710 [Maioricimonas sp. JB049]